MKYTQDFGWTFVVINDVKIPVPAGILFVTINMSGIVLGWSERPYISEGSWYCKSCPGYRIGYVEWEDDDTGRYNIYEVRS